LKIERIDLNEGLDPSVKNSQYEIKWNCVTDLIRQKGHTPLIPTQCMAGHTFWHSQFSIASPLLHICVWQNQLRWWPICLLVIVCWLFLNVSIQ
jgi:hypothetical protein